MLPANHQHVPQLRDVDRRAHQPAEVEELRPPVRAVVVVDRHFGNPEPGVLDLLHHLQADHAAALLERDPAEDRPPEQPEIAVHVADLQAEQQLDGVMVDASDDDAVQRIRAADLVAVDEVDAVVERFPEKRHLRRIVLRIAVRVEDQLARRRREAAAQRPAVAAVPLVMDDLDLGVGPRELVGDGRGRIGAAVVDDDDFEVGRQAPRGLQRGDDEARDGPAVVVGGKEHT